MKIPFALIVEGHGEEKAVPILLRRLLFEIDPQLQLDVRATIRVAATKLRKESEIERYVEAAARLGGPLCPVFVLLDCEDDCPAQLGPEFLDRATGARGDRAICIALAHREFETWFLAAAKSLRGKRGLPVDLEPPANPEGIRGAKEWLSRSMRTGAYKETVDQAALTALFDLSEAARIPSFARLDRKLRALVEARRSIS